MKKKNRSQVSVNPFDYVQEIDIPPLDVLKVTVQSLRLIDEDPMPFTIKVTFFDQLIIRGTIAPTPLNEVVNKSVRLSGTMSYDPSDYERICLMADHPLCVQIQPLDSEPKPSNSPVSDVSTNSRISSKAQVLEASSTSDISCCNVDILPLFIDEKTMFVQKRMEPLQKPAARFCKSWDNLPVLNMRLKVKRDKENALHHKVLKEANYLKMTLIASYNMPVPYDDEFVYTAASKLPIQNESNSSLVTFNQGCRVSKRFNGLKFTPKWESLRVGDENFTEGDVQFECSFEEIQNDTETRLDHCMDRNSYTTAWGAFHRTLLLRNSDVWFMEQINRYQWPLEIHMYGETNGYSLMAFLNLAKLLYPGEDTVRLAAPLLWLNADAMQQACGCDLLLTPNEKALSLQSPTQKTTSWRSPIPSSPSADAGSMNRSTGIDDHNAFVVLEFKLARPLKKAIILPFISPVELNSMLHKMEQAEPHKRKCSGRGQQERDWQSTVRNAAAALRRVPYYGMTEFCNFNRQLSETRARVELITSCWQDAAVYINNNFVVQDFLDTEETYEEMLIMGHASLLKSACATLVGMDNWQNMEPILRSARHARQMQDIPHAMELFLQLVVEKPRDAISWRELSTCLKDVDRDWANVCINKSVALDPRNPLSLLAKGCMVFEEDPAQAEPFFVALLALYPFWSTGWIVTSVYYMKRELFYMADQIIFYNRKTTLSGMSEEFGSPRTWERELGDWWDPTPILPGMSPYYDAADILLRLRAISLAEVCVARALCEAGETAAYFHLVALCCRLQGNYKGALCHIQAGIQKFGEINYLRTLEGECYQKLNEIPAAKESFEKAGSCVGGYSILVSTLYREQQRARTALVDLVRRQPSAYTWMALADHWLMNNEAESKGAGDRDTNADHVSPKTCAAACAIQALKIDRRTSRAWALLAKLVKPNARRQHCREMAKACGHVFTSSDTIETCVESLSQESLCYRFGSSEKKCACLTTDGMLV